MIGTRFYYKYLNFATAWMKDWIKNFTPDTCPKLLNLNQDHPLKKPVFLVKSFYYQSYDNFFHRNANNQTLVTFTL